MRKKFDQYCPMAHAAWLVGERWSLLIVRELLRGPKRYTDLGHGLPGIGTNILAARLRDLEECGVVQKRKLPPPAASTVYELTEYGAGLDEVLYALAAFRDSMSVLHLCTHPRSSDVLHSPVFMLVRAHAHAFYPRQILAARCGREGAVSGKGLSDSYWPRHPRLAKGRARQGAGPALLPQR